MTADLFERQPVSVVQPDEFLFTTGERRGDGSNVVAPLDVVLCGERADDVGGEVVEISEVFYPLTKSSGRLAVELSEVVNHAPLDPLPDVSSHVCVLPGIVFSEFVDKSKLPGRDEFLDGNEFRQFTFERGRDSLDKRQIQFKI